MNGFAGKILFVNLTDGTIKEDHLDEKIYRDFIGGYGLGIRILYETIKPNADPLGPDNYLGFVVGTCTGTTVPGSGRYGVVTKSPLTGTWAEANSGGTFGPDLKTAGFDGVFFYGISPKPVYLLIKDGKATLKDASTVWGKDSYDTEDILHKELGDDKIKIACIGPSGESVSLLAGIMNEKGRTAARSGVGAVMGSKRLKAVAVKGGFQKVTIGNPEKLKVVREQFMNDIKSSGFKKGLTEYGTGGRVGFLVSIGDSQVKNYQLAGIDSMPTANKLDSPNMDKYKIDSYGCYACPVRCGAIIENKEGPYAIPAEMHRPEYETLAAFGNSLCNDNIEAVIKANDICNRSGIDTISVGGTIAFAMECYQKGLITLKETGLDLTWGNADSIVKITEMMAKREGFGEVLADGVNKAIEKIGKASEPFAMAVRGRTLPYHDPRNAPARGSIYIMDANPANHTISAASSTLEAGGSLGVDPALQTVKTQAYGEYDKKGSAYSIGMEFNKLLDSAGLCSLYFLNSPAPPLAELIAGVTGWDFSWAEALKSARRILTLRQAFNAREGITPDQFEMPERLKQPHTVGPTLGVKIDFEAARDSYFRAMGWDPKSGKPYKQTLVELGLEVLVSDLVK
jgi:aldehyde:ferredoxin oxidoreductase